MLSIQFFELGERLLAHLSQDSPLWHVAARLAAIHEDTLRPGTEVLDSPNPPDIPNKVQEWRNSVRKAITELKTGNVSLIHVVNDASTLRNILTSLVTTIGTSTQPFILLHDIDVFLREYDRALRDQSLGNALRLMSAADHLVSSLATTRDFVLNLQGATEDERVADNTDRPERLLVVLFTDRPFDATVSKLTAINRISSELAALFPDGKSVFDVAKIETGSILLLVVGLPAFIKVFGSLLTAAIQYFHRNFTSEGRIASLPRKVEALDSILGIRTSLKAVGLPVDELDANISKAAVKIGQELNTLLGDEVEVQIGPQRFALSTADRPRFALEARRLLQLEATPERPADTA